MSDRTLPGYIHKMGTVFINQDTVFIIQELCFIVWTKEVRLDELRDLREVTLENPGTRSKLLGLVSTSTAAPQEQSPAAGDRLFPEICSDLLLCVGAFLACVYGGIN